MHIGSATFQQVDFGCKVCNSLLFIYVNMHVCNTLRDLLTSVEFYLAASMHIVCGVLNLCLTFRF